MNITALTTRNIPNPKFFYLIERLSAVNQREALLDWLTCRSRDILEVDSSLKDADILKLTGTAQEINNFQDRYALDIRFTANADTERFYPSNDEELSVYGVLIPAEQEDTVLLIKIADSNRVPAFNMGDRLYITSGMIANYTGKQQLLTDVGKLLMNQLLLVEPFGTLVPYLNERFDPGKLDDLVAKLIIEKKVTREMYNKYIENGYWYCEDGSLSTATWSEKSMMTDPKVLTRKKELLEQYKDQLNDPIILAKIEKELIAMDKEWLKDDPAAPFYAVEGGKAWKEQRKKMFIMIGMGTAFGKDANAITFTPESLEEGWHAEHLDTAANDIRRGSYGRGIETAKGGEQTKFVLRIFQDVTIDEEDCGSRKGLKITLTENNVKDYYQRYLTTGELLTPDNVASFIGKEVEIRSPMYCRTKPGFCYKCCGELFRTMGLKAIGMQAIGVTGSFTSLSMKSMHVSALSATNIRNFYKYLR